MDEKITLEVVALTRGYIDTKFRFCYGRIHIFFASNIRVG